MSASDDNLLLKKEATSPTPNKVFLNIFHGNPENSSHEANMVQGKNHCGLEPHYEGRELLAAADVRPKDKQPSIASCTS